MSERRWTGPYTADGNVVRKKPETTKNADGSSSITIGFPVCVMHEAASGQAATVASLMNAGTYAPDMADALEALANAVERDLPVRKHLTAARAALLRAKGERG